MQLYRNFYLIKKLGAGVEHIGGDMFESVPGGDAIFMKVTSFILHQFTLYRFDEVKSIIIKV